MNVEIGPGEAKDIAGKVVDSLRNSPTIIGLLCINILFIAGLFWNISRAGHERHEELLEILRTCDEQTQQPQFYPPPGYAPQYAPPYPPAVPKTGPREGEADY